MITHVYTWAEDSNQIVKIHTIENAVELNKESELFFSNVKRNIIESNEPS